MPMMMSERLHAGEALASPWLLATESGTVTVMRYDPVADRAQAVVS